MGLDVIDVALTDKGLTLCFVWILWFSVFWETVQLPGIKTHVKPRSWVLKEDAKICLYPPSHSPHRCLLCVFITTRHIHIRTRILTMWSCGSETHPLYNSPHQRQPEGVNANIYLPVKLFCSPLTYYSGTKTGDFFFSFQSASRVRVHSNQSSSLGCRALGGFYFYDFATRGTFKWVYSF